MTLSRPQITSGPTSKGPSRHDWADSPVILERRQAIRNQLAKEQEALRIAFLEWPTIEALEAFLEKRIEFDNMMHQHASDVQAALREQVVFVQEQNRAAQLAEERRLQEFQRALERMDPSEAEAAQQAERERSLRLQKEREARAAALDAEFARVKARVRAKYDSA